MPVLAARSTVGTTAAFRDPVSEHLATEFRKLPVEVVERRVADVRARAEHLGIAVTPEMVERVAREHLLALVNSAPPSRITR